MNSVDETLRSTVPASGEPESHPVRLGPYRIVRFVGAGGMGVVYEAIDEERGTRVALKTLSALTPGALLRFKQEYRSIADLTHVNLATLYELMATDDTWFFTMELVDGVNLLHHVWGGTELLSGTGLSPDVEHRLRGALHQLAIGVEALHAAKLLHLDLKPSNVLVEPSGRVVILDFGLVQSIERAAAADPDAGLAGTPLYVSPEQVLGAPARQASDWYSIGVILFEALTGTAPFRGNAVATMMERTLGPAPDPAARRAGLPADLVALCSALLAQEPSGRAGGRDILTVCDAARSAIRASGAHRIIASLVGRDAELAELHRLCEAGAPAQPLCVFVEGASGVGKTALAGDLLNRFESTGILVLRGRCYERESVPFKGFDAVVDELCRELAALPVAMQRALLDEDIHYTARIFSVLRDLEILPAIRLPPAEPLEPQALRLRAFGGLKRLLRRLAVQRRVVVFLDDLQWADADSAHLLRELLAPPDPPALLVIAVYRGDEAQQSRFLREFKAHQRSTTAAFREHTLTIEPLAQSAAEQLARSCLGPACDDERVRAVAREAGGIPFFIEAVARDSSAIGVEDARAVLPSLDRLIEMQLHDMPMVARRLLHVVSVAARPIEQGVALAAADLAGGGGSGPFAGSEQAALARLRSARLVRTRGPRGTDLVEPYHDRIRQTVAASLAPTLLADTHRRLATVLEAGQRAPAEALAFHLHGAGDLERAAEHAERAARQAVTALAFERAATLYSDVLRWGASGADKRREIQTERAQALFNAGRCGEAATGYLAAAEGAAPALRRDLRRRAAEAFLYGGHVDEGLQVARALLAEVGLPFPGSQRRAMLGVAAQLIYLRLRGIELAPGGGASAGDELFVIDLCWSLGKGLSNVLPIEGIYFMVLALSRALRHGEPNRVGRSLAFVGMTVLAQFKIGERYLERSEQLARDHADAYLGGLPLIMRGFNHVGQTGHWREASELVDRGVEILRSTSTGMSWEHTFGTGIALKALEAMGQLDEVGRRAIVWGRESQERGDKYAQVMSGQFEALSLIARGDVAAAREQDRRLIAMWSNHGYTVQHFYSLILRLYCDLYEGRQQAAWELFHGELPELEKIYYERFAITRVPIYYLRACLQIDRAHSHPDERAALLRAAGKLGKRLAKEQRVDGPVHAALIGAAIAAVRGDGARARSLLDDCRARYRQLDMRLMAACVERRLGELSGDRALVATADAEIARLGVVDPAAWAEAYVPRFTPAAVAPAAPSPAQPA